MACELLDSYSETNQDAAINLQKVHPSTVPAYSAMGQCFTMANQTKKICKAKFYLSKVGSPTGHVRAILYELTGTCGTNGKPNNNTLAISDPVDMAGIPPTFTLTDFIFSGGEQYTMQPNTAYAIEMIIADGTVDIGNRIDLGYDVSSPTHPGNASVYNNGAWFAYSALDTCFYLYGEEVGLELFESLSLIHLISRKSMPQFKELLTTEDTFGPFSLSGYFYETLKLIETRRSNFSRTLLDFLSFTDSISFFIFLEVRLFESLFLVSKFFFNAKKFILESLMAKDSFFRPPVFLELFEFLILFPRLTLIRYIYEEGYRIFLSLPFARRMIIKLKEKLAY